MPDLPNEVRDAIHGFVKYSSRERDLINCKSFQRLRSIRQLATTSLIYPGAVHNRFEHSIGVMGLADQIFASLFEGRVTDQVHERIQAELASDRREYWRQVVRVAGLLHDLGHLPFSHAAEKELLPTDWNHERITANWIRESDEIKGILAQPPIVNPEDVVDVAWDISKRTKVEPDKVESLSPWKLILNELICGDTFGADRIDYLLRDSWHAGVRYGRFDPARLIAGLTLVINPADEEISLAIESSAIHAAEALLVARYFMYQQVYFHHVRRAYDLHLKEFLQDWLPNGRFPTDWRELTGFTDDEVMVAMRKAALDTDLPGHQNAKRMMQRDHFRTVYHATLSHIEQCPNIVNDVLDYCTDKYGADIVRKDDYWPKASPNEFDILMRDKTIESSIKVSTLIANIPAAKFGFVFVAPEEAKKAAEEVRKKIPELLSTGRKGEK